MRETVGAGYSQSSVLRPVHNLFQKQFQMVQFCA